MPGRAAALARAVVGAAAVDGRVEAPIAALALALAPSASLPLPMRRAFAADDIGRLRFHADARCSTLLLASHVGSTLGAPLLEAEIAETSEPRSDESTLPLAPLRSVESDEARRRPLPTDRDERTPPLCAPSPSPACTRCGSLPDRVSCRRCTSVLLSAEGMLILAESAAAAAAVAAISLSTPPTA